MSRRGRYWVSWYQPTDDYRPIYDPTKESAPFGHRYWCSGQRDSDGAWTLCAVVDAVGKLAAQTAVRRYWPEATEWRFCEPREQGWLPPEDRFPMPKPATPCPSAI